MPSLRLAMQQIKCRSFPAVSIENRRFCYEL
nr:MAG TPA: hypothetical protein [Caudoviricetes sp.]